MKAAAASHRLARFEEWCGDVPCTPRNTVDRVEQELGYPLTRAQAAKLLSAWAAAILTEKYGAAKPKPKKTGG